ncbi:beta-L-arabinofuranosidase domain-containing protein [Kibdelosporangium aridum]|uniref:PCZA361.31 n=1 Tax=Amycolatopsis orientalis TaxID=31958 RepID=O52814_AMYOR|nr:beta-L-arabinofuranosidase domain-containing protein [Kibdelosporangium aridum]CAA11789.1 PCZA361.31 [Amycolatopsis orientalis]
MLSRHRQETRFPESPSTRLTFTGSGQTTRKLRIPSWTSNARIRINGTTNPSTMPTLNPASIRTTSTPLQFTATASTGPVNLLPFYAMHGQRYTVYWRIGSAAP